MALAILEFRDDSADSIMLPPYVAGRCGDRGIGHSSNINMIFVPSVLRPYLPLWEVGVLFVVRLHCTQLEGRTVIARGVLPGHRTCPSPE